MALLLRAQAIVRTREASAAEERPILGTESVTELLWVTFILARCWWRLSAGQAARRLLGAERQRRNNTHPLGHGMMLTPSVDVTFLAQAVDVMTVETGIHINGRRMLRIPSEVTASSITWSGASHALG